MQAIFRKTYTLTNPYILDEESRPLKKGYYSSIRQEPKIGRNELCTCCSGKKFKNCCMNFN